MDDTTKFAASAAARIEQDPESTSQKSGDAFVAYMDDSTEQSGSSVAGKENLTTSAKALDRWFKERQKNHGAPRLLEVPNESLVTNAGPLQLTGNLTLVHDDGTVQYANHLTLCRCGHSESKPTCDNQHLEKEFLNPADSFLHQGRTHYIPRPLAPAQSIWAGMCEDARLALPLRPIRQQAIL